MPYIHYSVQFRKDKEATIWALIDLGSKVNSMTPAYVKQLDLQVQTTDGRAQKIDGSSFWNFGIVVACF